MKICIDGQEYSDFPEGTRAADVLTEVKIRVSKDGRVITEIRVDGIVMDEEAFSNLAGGLQVHFASQSVRDLVRESLDEALRYIPRLTKGLEEIATHFEGDELALAQSRLADAADGLDWLLTVFQNCTSLLGIGQETEDTGIEELKGELSDSIAQLGTLYGEKKYLRMALCIRQRLLPEIETFSLHIRRLHDLGKSTQ